MKKKNNNNKRNIHSNIRLAFIIILILLVSFLVYYGEVVPRVNNDLAKVEFDGNFNESEKEIIDDIYNNLDKNYLKFTQKIVITKDLVKYCKSHSCSSKGDKNIFKLKTGRTRCILGNCMIMVDYKAVQRYTLNHQKAFINELKTTLCHELGHTFIFNSVKETHYIVDDIGEKKVCYK